MTSEKSHNLYKNLKEIISFTSRVYSSIAIDSYLEK